MKRDHSTRNTRTRTSACFSLIHIHTSPAHVFCACLGTDSARILNTLPRADDHTRHAGVETARLKQQTLSTLSSPWTHGTTTCTIVSAALELNHQLVRSDRREPL